MKHLTQAVVNPLSRGVPQQPLGGPTSDRSRCHEFQGRAAEAVWLSGLPGRWAPRLGHKLSRTLPGCWALRLSCPWCSKEPNGSFSFLAWGPATPELSWVCCSEAGSGPNMCSVLVRRRVITVLPIIITQLYLQSIRGGLDLHLYQAYICITHFDTVLLIKSLRLIKMSDIHTQTFSFCLLLSFCQHLGVQCLLVTPASFPASSLAVMVWTRASCSLPLLEAVIK